MRCWRALRFPDPPAIHTPCGSIAPARAASTKAHGCRSVASRFGLDRAVHHGIDEAFGPLVEIIRDPDLTAKGTKLARRFPLDDRFGRRPPFGYRLAARDDQEAGPALRLPQIVAELAPQLPHADSDRFALFGHVSPDCVHGMCTPKFTRGQIRRRAAFSGRCARSGSRIRGRTSPGSGSCR